MRLAIAAFLALLPLLGHAGSLADVEVYDRTRGHELPVHTSGGRLYIAGEPGHQYLIRIRSRSSQRLLAVTSVDGVNVVTGETAATSQRGYVLEPWGSVAIEGWRKSLEEVATFYFTTLTDSYAARTGRPDNTGVIGIALFEEVPRHRPAFGHEPVPPSASRAESADESVARRQSSESLGTGHGHRESSQARYVDFRRAGAPVETLTLYYDSHRNLVAQNILPPAPRLVKREPHPFPAGFVPDP